MFICPNCGTRLSKVASPAGFFWSCPVCNGRAVTLPVLKKAAPQKKIRELWQDARSRKDVGDRSCPACNRKMSVVSVAGVGGDLSLDMCPGCYMIWFDPQELEQIPGTDQGSLTAQKDLSMEAKTALAQGELELLRERQKATIDLPSNPPDNWWELIPAVFGLPVEYNDQGIFEWPIVTWSLAAVLLLISVASYSGLDALVENWGLVPAELYRHFGATLITSFFLHGGFIHLLGNLYFLLIFGDNVEDDLGWRKYVLLLAASALLGDAFHVLGDPRSAIPVIGASGGISGIIVYYALQFPKARIGMLMFFRWYRIPVGVLLFLWLLMQVVGALLQISGFSNVSALGHLGGASVGFLFWLYSSKFTPAMQ